MGNIEIAVKRQKRFTRARLVDQDGNDIAGGLCDLRVAPCSSSRTR
jgi:hypothetical protein